MPKTRNQFADIAQACPAIIPTGRFGAELGLGIHLVLASTREDHEPGRGERGRGRVWLGCALTGGTGRLGGKARKRLRVLRTPRGVLDRLAMDGGRYSLVPSPQLSAGYAQTHESEQCEVVKRQVVSHLVLLHAYQVNGGIPLLVQAGDLSAGHRYTTNDFRADELLVRTGEFVTYFDHFDLLQAAIN